MPTPSSPIGVYDSGVGGISVLRALRAALPAESFVYVADSLHAPYGDRPQHYLRERAHAVVGFLARQGARAVVLACNTVSVAASASLRAAHDFPIIAMEPAIKPAAASTRSGTVLVLATAYTVGSAAVQRLCERYGEGVRIVLQACPGLAEQVERGELATPATRELLQRYLRPGLEAGADTVVLGCTHYAFLQPQIAALAGPGVALIEPSPAIARQLRERLPAADAAAAASLGTRVDGTTAPGLSAARLSAPGLSAPGLFAPGLSAPGTTRYCTSGSPQALARFLGLVGEAADADAVQPLPVARG